MLTRIAPSFAVPYWTNDPLGAVRRPDADPVALAHAERVEPERAGVDLGDELRVAPAAAGARTRPAPRGRRPAPPSGPGSPRSCRPAGAPSRSRCCRTAARERSPSAVDSAIRRRPGWAGRSGARSGSARAAAGSCGPRRTATAARPSSLVSSVSGGPPSSDCPQVGSTRCGFFALRLAMSPPGASVHTPCTVDVHRLADIFPQPVPSPRSARESVPRTNARAVGAAT